MAASFDTIPPPLLSITRIAQRLDIGLDGPQHVADLIVDYLLDGDRSRPLWIYRGRRYEPGRPWALMRFEDYLDQLARRPVAQGRQMIADNVMLKPCELVEIARAHGLPRSAWLEMWVDAVRLPERRRENNGLPFLVELPGRHRGRPPRVTAEEIRKIHAGISADLRGKSRQAAINDVLKERGFSTVSEDTISRALASRKNHPQN
jgi:hypothetical protein